MSEKKSNIFIAELSINQSISPRDMIIQSYSLLNQSIDRRVIDFEISFLHFVGVFALQYADENLAVMSVGFLLGSRDDAVIWRGPKKNTMIKNFLRDVDWGDLEYLVVDTPPGTSDEHLSVVTYLAKAGIDGAIIVTTPQEVALQDVRKEINFCRKVNVPILGVVENMSGFVCPKCKVSVFVSFFPAKIGFLWGKWVWLCRLNRPFFRRPPEERRKCARTTTSLYWAEFLWIRW